MQIDNPTLLGFSATDEGYLNDNFLYLRSGVTSFVRYYTNFADTAINGAVLAGDNGGALGSTSTGDLWALRWDTNQDVFFGNNIDIPGNITVTGTVDGVDVDALASTVSTNTGNISTNAGNIASIQSDLAGFPDELKNLTTAEIQQLENIGETTISATQWGYLGNLDQGLTTTSNVSFGTISTTGISSTGSINIARFDAQFVQMQIQNTSSGTDWEFRSTGASYVDGAGKLVLYNNTDNVEAAFVDEDGKWGFGDIIPSETITANGSVYVNAENSGFIVDASNSKRVGLMKYSGSEGVLARVASQDFGICRTGGSDISDGSSLEYDFYIDGTGQVVINDTAAYSLLTLRAPINDGDGSYIYGLTFRSNNNTNAAIWSDQIAGGHGELVLGTNNGGTSGTPTERARINLNGLAAFGDTTNFNAQMTVDQPNSSAAIPVLVLNQDDVDDSFINYTGTDGSGNSIHTGGSVGSFAGVIRVEINGTQKLMAFYDNP